MPKTKKTLGPNKKKLTFFERARQDSAASVSPYRDLSDEQRKGMTNEERVLEAKRLGDRTCADCKKQFYGDTYRNDKDEVICFFCFTGKSADRYRGLPVIVAQRPHPTTKMEQLARRMLQERTDSFKRRGITNEDQCECEPGEMCDDCMLRRKEKEHKTKLTPGERFRAKRLKFLSKRLYSMTQELEDIRVEVSCMKDCALEL